MEAVAGQGKCTVCGWPLGRREMERGACRVCAPSPRTRGGWSREARVRVLALAVPVLMLPVHGLVVVLHHAGELGDGWANWIGISIVWPVASAFAAYLALRYAGWTDPDPATLRRLDAQRRRLGEESAVFAATDSCRIPRLALVGAACVGVVLHRLLDAVLRLWT